MSLRERFDRDGYAVVPDFKSPAAIAELRARAAEIVGAFDPAESSAIFTTRDESTKSNDYFLTSGDKIRCFFEEEAFDETGALRRPKELSINKIGHAMHDLDPVFERFSRDPRLHAFALELGLAEPRVYQSMYIFKQPRIGGEVRWHQDATYFDTDPVSVTTLWFALERADRSNGCLWVQRGAHARRCASASSSMAAPEGSSASTRRRGRRRTTPSPSRSRPARSSSCTGGSRTTARRTARQRHGTRTRCTPSTRARAIRPRTGCSATRRSPLAVSSDAGRDARHERVHVQLRQRRRRDRR